MVRFGAVAFWLVVKPFSAFAFFIEGFGAVAFWLVVKREDYPNFIDCSFGAVAFWLVAKQNFSNPYDYNKKTGMGDKRDSRRVVLNLRYRDDGVPYEDIESRIKYESEKLRIKEVLVVDRNGAVRRYKNSWPSLSLQGGGQPLTGLYHILFWSSGILTGSQTNRSTGSNI